VEDFGASAFEPRAFAGGHDGDGEFWGVHRTLSSHVRVVGFIPRRREWFVVGGGKTDRALRDGPIMR
jgi:hypothetical protein